jgi:hypothetical protein
VGTKRNKQEYGENSFRKKLLGRPKQRWEDNINIYLKEIGQEVGDRIYVA